MACNLLATMEYDGVLLATSRSRSTYNMYMPYKRCDMNAINCCRVIATHQQHFYEYLKTFWTKNVNGPRVFPVRLRVSTEKCSRNTCPQFTARDKATELNTRAVCKRKKRRIQMFAQPFFFGAGALAVVVHLSCYHWTGIVARYAFIKRVGCVSVLLFCTVLTINRIIRRAGAAFAAPCRRAL